MSASRQSPAQRRAVDRVQTGVRIERRDPSRPQGLRGLAGTIGRRPDRGDRSARVRRRLPFRARVARQGPSPQGGLRPRSHRGRQPSAGRARVEGARFRAQTGRHPLKRPFWVSGGSGRLIFPDRAGGNERGCTRSEGDRGETRAACRVQHCQRWCWDDHPHGHSALTMVLAPISAPLQAGSGAPPIGSPVSGAALFVLDRWLRAVPAGVVGELYVAGRGVGVGDPEPGPVDGVAICGVPVWRRQNPRDKDVSHRGLGVLATRRAADLPGPRRRAGEDPRVSHRAR